MTNQNSRDLVASHSIATMLVLDDLLLLEEPQEITGAIIEAIVGDKRLPLEIGAGWALARRDEKDSMLGLLKHMSEMVTVDTLAVTLDDEEKAEAVQQAAVELLEIFPVECLELHAMLIHSDSLSPDFLEAIELKSIRSFVIEAADVHDLPEEAHFIDLGPFLPALKNVEDVRITSTTRPLKPSPLRRLVTFPALASLGCLCNVDTTTLQLLARGLRSSDSLQSMTLLFLANLDMQVLEAFSNAAQACATLESLTLICTDISETAWLSMQPLFAKSWDRLKIYSGQPLSDAAMAAYAQILNDPRTLYRDSTIQTWDAEELGLNDGFGVCLEHICVRHAMQDMLLSDNAFGDATARSLATALEHPSCQLARLNLSHNALGNDGMVELLRATTTNKSLVSLTLDGNANVTNDVWGRVATALRTSRLECLSLSKLPIDDDSLNLLVDGLAENKHLRQLTLGSEDTERPGLSPATFDKLVDLLDTKNGTLTNVSVLHASKEQQRVLSFFGAMNADLDRRQLLSPSSRPLDWWKAIIVAQELDLSVLYYLVSKQPALLVAQYQGE